MPFELAPATIGTPPVTPQNFPKMIQVRHNGVDVGDPAEVHTINFVGTAFTLTRDGGKLTIEIE